MRGEMEATTREAVIIRLRTQRIQPHAGEDQGEGQGPRSRDQPARVSATPVKQRRHRHLHAPVRDHDRRRPAARAVPRHPLGADRQQAAPQDHPRGQGRRRGRLDVRRRAAQAPEGLRRPLHQHGRGRRGRRYPRHHPEPPRRLHGEGRPAEEQDQGRDDLSRPRIVTVAVARDRRSCSSTSSRSSPSSSRASARRCRRRRSSSSTSRTSRSRNFCRSSARLVAGHRRAASCGSTRTEQRAATAIDRLPAPLPGLRRPDPQDRRSRASRARSARWCRRACPSSTRSRSPARTAGNKVVEEAIFATRSSISEGKTIAEPLDRRARSSRRWSAR